MPRRRSDAAARGAAGLARRPTALVAVEEQAVDGDAGLRPRRTFGTVIDRETQRLPSVADRLVRRKGGAAETDDRSLTQKVENELFRPGDVPKSRIDVDVENGGVRLRGEVERHELIDELEHRTRRVEGVRDVENLVHLPTAAGAVHG